MENGMDIGAQIFLIFVVLSCLVAFLIGVLNARVEETWGATFLYFFIAYVLSTCMLIVVRQWAIVAFLAPPVVYLISFVTARKRVKIRRELDQQMASKANADRMVAYNRGVNAARSTDEAWALKQQAEDILRQYSYRIDREFYYGPNQCCFCGSLGANHNRYWVHYKGHTGGFCDEYCASEFQRAYMLDESTMHVPKSRQRNTTTIKRRIKG